MCHEVECLFEQVHGEIIWKFTTGQWITWNVCVVRLIVDQGMQ